MAESLTDDNFTDYYEYDFIFDDYSQHIIVAISFLVGSILGILGNTLVIFSVFASSKLRTSTNAFVVNLSIADLITSLLIPWNAVILLSLEEYPVADWWCGVVAGIMFICVGCSLFTLASIAITRLMLITRPISTSTSLLSPVYTALWIAALWVVSFLFNVLPALVDAGELGISQKYRICASKAAHPRSDTFDNIQAIGCFPVPLVTLVVCYVAIFVHLRRYARSFNTTQPHDIPMSSTVVDGGDITSTTVVGKGSLTSLSTAGAVGGGDSLLTHVASSNSNNGNESNSSSSDSSSTAAAETGKADTNPRKPTTAATAPSANEINRRKREHTLRKRQIRVTKNMFIVFLAYVICNLPLALTLVDILPQSVVPYATALILLNSCINPILYGFKHPTFKEVFIILLSRRWKNVPEPSPSFKQLRERCCCCDKH